MDREIKKADEDDKYYEICPICLGEKEKGQFCSYCDNRKMD